MKVVNAAAAASGRRTSPTNAALALPLTMALLGASPTLAAQASYRFDVWTTDNGHQTLREDRDGGLWMGTEDAGVVRMRAGVFASYGTRDGLPGNDVFRIDEDDAGRIIESRFVTRFISRT